MKDMNLSQIQIPECSVIGIKKSTHGYAKIRIQRVGCSQTSVKFVDPSTCQCVVPAMKRMINTRQILIVAQIIMKHLVCGSCSRNHCALRGCNVRFVQILRPAPWCWLRCGEILQQPSRNALWRSRLHIVCELRRLHLKRQSLRQRISSAFVRSKKEGLFLVDRSAYTGSELIEYLRRSLGCKVISRIEVGILEIFPRLPMKLVRSRSSAHIDY